MAKINNNNNKNVQENKSQEKSQQFKAIYPATIMLRITRETIAKQGKNYRIK